MDFIGCSNSAAGIDCAKILHGAEAIKDRGLGGEKSITVDLLHPAIGQMVNETVVIQGHPIRFATVNLTASPAEIQLQLLSLYEPVIK